MSTRYPMHCRFSEECGTFSNGISLRKHYDANHPEYVPGGLGRVRCDACGAELLYASFANHVLGRHPDQSVTYTSIGAAPGRRSRSLSTVAPTPSRPSHARTAPDPVMLGPLDADEIVIGAVTALAAPGNVVPVAHLAALFLWRDQTAVMLASITGKVDR